ncbi:phospholipase D-like domain-containing protein [Alphaproteobacteria bacterium]|nr:phospholipase D-like domain-containing protein [Alphaproteobacteria bacterium]
MKMKFTPRDLPFIIVITVLSSVLYFKEDAPLSFNELQVQSCFTPEQKCLPKITQFIDGAKKEIVVHSYSFTNVPIKEAMDRAAGRGVNIIIHIDEGKLKERGNQKLKLSSSKFEIIPMKMRGLFHNKTMIIDGETVITGSYNWSHAAEYRNSENLLFLQSKELAQKYKTRTFS